MLRLPVGDLNDSGYNMLVLLQDEVNLSSNEVWINIRVYQYQTK